MSQYAHRPTASIIPIVIIIKIIIIIIIISSNNSNRDCNHRCRVATLSSYLAHHYSRRRHFQSFTAGQLRSSNEISVSASSRRRRGPIERDSRAIGDGSASLTISRVTIGLTPGRQSARPTRRPVDGRAVTEWRVAVRRDSRSLSRLTRPASRILRSFADLPRNKCFTGPHPF